MGCVSNLGHADLRKMFSRLRSTNPEFRRQKWWEKGQTLSSIDPFLETWKAEYLLID